MQRYVWSNRAASYNSCRFVVDLVISVSVADAASRGASQVQNFKTRGNQSLRMGEFGEAAHFYSEAIAAVGTNPIYYNNRAIANVSAEIGAACAECSAFASVCKVCACVAVEDETF